MRKTVQDIVINLVEFFNNNKKNNKTIFNLNKISELTGLANVVVNRYIDIFYSLNQLDIKLKISNRGTERIIDISKFNLQIRGGK